MTARFARTPLVLALAGLLVWLGSGIAAADVSPAEQTAMLAAQNNLRRSVATAETQRLGRTVTIPDLTWNANAASVAQAWANNLLATGTFDHNPNANAFGENIYTEGGGDPSTSAMRAVTLWASEQSSYNWDANTCNGVCGHYTQLVWANTTSVGCGKASNAMRTVWVCDYAPPGNFIGERPYEPGAAAPAGQANPAPQGGQANPGSNTVTYAPGWNIVAGTPGTSFPQTSGPLYTLQPGDTAYQMLSAGSQVTAGRGYWAFFTGPVTVTLAGAGAGPITIAAPARQWIMAGNPTNATATIRGADVVFTWDPVAGMYSQGNTLKPGQGAWVFSNNGGTITVGQ